jgi:hypothetical protein
MRQVSLLHTKLPALPRCGSKHSLSWSTKFGLLLVLLNSHVYAEEAWNLRKDEQGIAVYSRAVDGSKYKEFKGVVTLQATLANTLALLDDSSACAQWLHLCERSEILEENGIFERFVYQISDLPFPARSRDAIFKIVGSHHKNGTIQIDLTSVPDHIKESKYVRIREAYGRYTLQTIDDHHTLLTWTQYVDPTGSLPAFLVNSMVTDIPFKSLLNFRKLVGSKKYRETVFVYDKSGRPTDLKRKTD